MIVFTKDMEIKGVIKQFKIGKNRFGVFYKCQIQIFNDLFIIFIDEKIFNLLQLKENKQVLVYRDENLKGEFWKFNQKGTIEWFKAREKLKKSITKDK